MSFCVLARGIPATHQNYVAIPNIGLKNNFSHLYDSLSLPPLYFSYPNSFGAIPNWLDFKSKAN